MSDLIIVQEGDSVIDRFRAPKTAAEVLNALRRIGELRDEGGVRLLGSDSLEARNYTFKQIDVPSTPAAAETGRHIMDSVLRVTMKAFSNDLWAAATLWSTSGFRQSEGRNPEEYFYKALSDTAVVAALKRAFLQASAPDLSSISKEMKGVMEISLSVKNQLQEMMGVMEISLVPVKKQLQYTKSKMSRGLNNNFKEALVDFYGVEKEDTSPTGSKNPKLRCMMTGLMLRRRDVCAAHLIGHSMQYYALNFFGITDIDSPRNGLLVVKLIEEAFDDSRLCFSFDVTMSGFILHVLDASYLTQKLSDHRQLTRPTKRILGNTTFGDLEGRSLQFPNSMRPLKRVLRFQARQAIALATERGTLPETFSAMQWDFDYGSPGDYKFIVDKWFTDNDLSPLEPEVSSDSGPSHESTSNNESGNSSS